MDEKYRLTRRGAAAVARWRAHAPCALGAYTWRSASALCEASTLSARTPAACHTPLSSSRVLAARRCTSETSPESQLIKTVCAPVATSPAHSCADADARRPLPRYESEAARPTLCQPARGEEAEAASATRDKLPAAQRTSDAAGDANHDLARVLSRLQRAKGQLGLTLEIEAPQRQRREGTSVRPARQRAEQPVHPRRAFRPVGIDGDGAVGCVCGCAGLARGARSLACQSPRRRRARRAPQTTPR